MRHVLSACGVLAILCALFAGCGADSDDAAPSSEPPAWNHDPADATLGPTAWGEIDESFEQCSSGESQSPVDVTGAVEADLPDLEFDYPETSVIVENTGHTIEARLPEDSEHTLRIGDDEYRLVQFHFHAPSEHTVTSKSYDVEVHLVHESDEGELAVFAVFLERAESVPTYVSKVVESAPEIAGADFELDEERSPLELLGIDATSALIDDYATYSGSLTTPGCTEGVRWIVDDGPLPEPEAAIDRLHELIAGFPDYDGYENNNRSTQPLNDREVQRTSQP